MTPDERAKIAAMMGVATPRFVDGDPRSATAPSLVPKGWKPDTSRRVSTIDQMFNGTGIPERLGLLNSMFNPVTAMQEAGQHSEDMFAPGKTGWERVGSLGGMLSGVAGVVAPVAGAKLAGGKTVDALVESLTGVSTAPRAMAGEFMADEFGGVKLPFGGKDEGFTAYHGSPHDFDKFSMDKIGTGTGEQAYGKGLYFTADERVAKAYRDRLSVRNVDLNTPEGFADAVAEQYGAKIAAQKLSAMPPTEFNAAALARIKGKKTQKVGRMYEVKVNARADDFFDYDAFPDQQTDAGKRFIQDQIGAVPDNSGGSIMASLSSRASRAGKGEGPVSGVHPATIEDMKAAGIPGIKFKRDGSQNYVVFDEKIISIVRTYGIAAAAAMLGLSQADVVQASGIKDDGQAKTNAAIAKMVRPQ